MRGKLERKQSQAEFLPGSQASGTVTGLGEKQKGNFLGTILLISWGLKEHPTDPIIHSASVC
jgi:hypothetical protein